MIYSIIIQPKQSSIQIQYDTRIWYMELCAVYTRTTMNGELTSWGLIKEDWTVLWLVTRYLKICCISCCRSMRLIVCWSLSMYVKMWSLVRWTDERILAVGRSLTKYNKWIDQTYKEKYKLYVFLSVSTYLRVDCSVWLLSTIPYFPYFVCFCFIMLLRAVQLVVINRVLYIIVQSVNFLTDALCVEYQAPPSYIL